MNWFKKTFSFANPTQPTPPIPVGQMPVYPKAELNTFIRAFSNNASLYIIVSMIARKFAYIPRVVYNIKDTGAEKQYKFKTRQRSSKLKEIKDLHKKAYDETVVTDSPLSQLIMQPNEDYGQDAYYELLATYELLTGESFQWLNRGLSPEQLLPEEQGGLSEDEIIATPIIERILLPPQFVGLIIQRDSYSVTGGQITGYQIINNGKPINLRKEEVLHWAKPNPNFNWWDLSHFRGLSPLYAGLKILTQDDAITDAAVAMYQNGGARGAIAGANNLSPEQLKSIDKAIDSKVNNNWNKGKVARIPGDWTYLEMGMSSVDMELVDATDKVFTKICNLYGVNPNLFMTGSTFNNIEQARADFMTNLVIPMACSLRDEENRMFLPAFGLSMNSTGKVAQTVTTDLDISGLSELQDDMEKVAASLVPAWWLTGNERRTIMEQEESTDPNMDTFFVPNNLITIDDAAMPPETLNTTPYGAGASGNGNLSNGNGKPVPAGKGDR